MEQVVSGLEQSQLKIRLDPRVKVRPRFAPRLAAKAGSRTGRFDHILIIATIVFLPLQEQISIVAGSVSGLSFMFLLFGTVGGYLALTQPHAIQKAARQPLFLAAYGLLAVGFLFESMSPYTSYLELQRYAFMIGGGIIVAALCRDRKAVLAALYGYAISGIWLSLFLFINFYGSFGANAGSNLYEATAIRDSIFRENWLETGLNTIAFIIAQAFVVSLTLALTSRSRLQRRLFFAVLMLCAVATFLPMSRSGILIAGLAGAALIGSSTGKRLRAVAAIAALAACVYIWAPRPAIIRLWSSVDSSYFSSMSSSQASRDADARSKVYAAAVEHLPEYVTMGIGAGNFWSIWGRTHGFSPHRGVSGAHNSFLQVTIYWGIVGLLGLLCVTWQVIRCVPRRFGTDPLSLACFGIAVSLVLWLFFMHNIYSKEFSLGFGLLAGARMWIWPNGLPASRRRVRLIGIGPPKGCNRRKEESH
jgi:hypothetical protein